jgi:hypothetical protein
MWPSVAIIVGGLVLLGLASMALAAKLSDAHGPGEAQSLAATAARLDSEADILDAQADRLREEDPSSLTAGKCSRMAIAAREAASRIRWKLDERYAATWPDVMVSGTV